MHARIGISMVVLLALPACSSEQPVPKKAHEVPPVSTSPGEGGAAPWVDVFVGTGDAVTKSPVPNGRGGSTFPGASLPFGMVQWSPDTPGGAPPGYYYPDDTIVGFSLTHLSGAGCLAMRDFPIFPLVGAIDPETEPSARFDHKNEIASPGFYEVTLDSGIKVDLTATARTGLARFTFPKAPDAKLLVVGSFARDRLQVFDFHAKIEGPTLVTGKRDNGFFCASNTSYSIYFAARLDRPAKEHGAWSGGEAHAGDDEVSGLESGLWLGFDTREDPIVHMKIGLSYVSAENAQKNLDAENEGWDFDQVHEAAIATWNDHLGRVAVEGGTGDERRAFYTGLYHTLLQPSVISDANGDYPPFGGGVENAAPDARYSLFSGWDTYRSWVQLASVILPERTSEMMRSLVASGAECGALPKWPIANQESSTMVGDPAPILVASAWAFGARDFDAAQALSLGLHTANDPAAACDGKIVRDGLADYLARGYCPIDGKPAAWGSVSTTLEYAVADFALAQLAAAQGDTASHDALLARGRNWQNVFDPSVVGNGFTGYVQPRRLADQGGAPSFDEVDVTSDKGFVEGNPAQYTWMVPHDIPGLAARLGGETAAIARLDAFVTELNAGTTLPYLYIGNEPGFHVPWAYSHLGAPWKTQEVVARVLDEAYSTTPGGLPGNDDLGATSSWQVWAMLGMFPAVPGASQVVLASPRFPRATITLAGGKKLVIVAENAGKGARYVEGVRWNGKAITASWLSWDTLAEGGTLEFTLSASPNQAWGAAAADRPPAFYP